MTSAFQANAMFYGNGLGYLTMQNMKNALGAHENSPVTVSPFRYMLLQTDPQPYIFESPW